MSVGKVCMITKKIFLVGGRAESLYPLWGSAQTWGDEELMNPGLKNSFLSWHPIPSEIVHWVLVQCRQKVPHSSMSAIGHLPRLVMLQGKLPQESKGIDHWPLPLMKYQNPEPWNSSGPHPMAQESKI